MVGMPEEEADRVFRGGWEEFNELVEEAAEYVFGEQGVKELALVVGGQWGNVGDPDRVLVSANMSPCLTAAALQNLQARADQIHAESHRQAMQDEVGDGAVVESVGFAEAPEDVRDALAEFARGLGLDPEAVRFFNVADISDLTDLPPEDLRRPIEPDDDEE